MPENLHQPIPHTPKNKMNKCILCQYVIKISAMVCQMSQGKKEKTVPFSAWSPLPCRKNTSCLLTSPRLFFFPSAFFLRSFSFPSLDFLLRDRLHRVFTDLPEVKVYERHSFHALRTKSEKTTQTHNDSTETAIDSLTICFLYYLNVRKTKIVKN